MQRRKKDSSKFKGLYKERRKNKKVRGYISTIKKPSDIALSNTVNNLTQEFIQELTNSNKDLEKYKIMARQDPTVRACLELKAVRASNSFGRYNHNFDPIEKWVNANFENMQGSLSHTIGRLAGTAMNMGFALAEIQWDTRFPGKKKEWRLKAINILDPTKITFEGRSGEIRFVKYVNKKGEEKHIDYRHCIHIVNGMSLTIDDDESSIVYGDPDSRTAYKYYKAKQAILSEMMVSAKTNSTGVWVGKADSNKTVQVVDMYGRPQTNPDGSVKTESSLTALLRQLQHIENNSAIVTDTGNELTPLFGNTGEGMWNTAFTLLDKAIKMSYGVPELIFNEGSGTLGVNGLGTQHKTIMDSQIEAVVLQIQDQFIEKIVRPLLIYNFSIHDDFGQFHVDPEMDPQSVSTRINNIVSAASSQIIPSSDLRVQNAVYEALGLPSVSEQERQFLQRQSLMKIYLENQVYAGMNPLTGAMPPPQPQLPEEEEEVSEE